MTDSTTPDGSAPTPEDVKNAAGARESDGNQADGKKEPAPATEPADKDTPGAPTSSEPLTDSTDGGLDGGDPGVEE
ncbi:hypothetical protein [Agromyces subbeticus]|uniref:hypothetical protein n=1 Tax=Agromyces subbeticus TaxID=293890 RepID=UPI0012EC2625|nr:hypothetical protein [Agromyces subbeticus]